MKSTRYFICFFFIVVVNSSKAQVQFSGWLASFNTFKLNNKLSIHFDGQLRSTDEWQQVQTILLRPGLNVHLNKNWVATGGYAFIGNRRTLSGISDLLPEHRIWQQALVSHKVKRVSISHRFRFEQRFIAKAILSNDELTTDGFNQAFRFRYFIRNVIPLTSRETFTKGPFFALQNEVFLNTGDKTAVNGKTFDQNRFYAAIGYRLPAKIDLESGYMNQYSNTSTSFTNNHIIQIAIYRRL